VKNSDLISDEEEDEIDDDFQEKDSSPNPNLNQTNESNIAEPCAK